MMSMLVVYATTLFCLAEAVPAATTSCAAAAQSEVQEASRETRGSALLQLTGAVGKRGPAEGEDEAVSAGAASPVNSKEKSAVVVAALQDEKPAKDVTPKIELDTKGNNNLDNLNVNNGDNFANLNTNNGNNNLDVNNIDNVKDDKKGGGKKIRDNAFNFENNNNDNKGTPKVAIDNFDFGEGPIKSVERTNAAVEATKVKAAEAVGKAEKALEEAEKSQEAVRLAVDSIKSAVTSESKKLQQDLAKITDNVQSRLTEAEDKVKEAQKDLHKIKNEMAPTRSATYPRCLPRVWFLAAACSWLLCIV